jgi:hypothetical protein
MFVAIASKTSRIYLKLAFACENVSQSPSIITLVGETLSSCCLAFHRLFAAAFRHAVS